MIEPYYTVEDMIEMIDEPYQEACFRIFEDNLQLFRTVQGSTHNHQAWPGGYMDHVQEIMNIVILLFDKLDSVRQLPFSLSDALLIVFLHDIEKPWKYELGPDGQLQEIEALRDKQAQHEFREKKIREYGLSLTHDQQNALKYVEGESKDYSNKKRVMGPLAALCHLADVTSARIWFDHPMKKDDPWNGARRIWNGNKRTR